MTKTIEELEKDLHNARSSLSYHKNKNKHNKKKPKGESPRAKVNRLASNIVWNDKKKAMAHVVACLTANAADYKEAFNQAYIMPVVEVRDLVKGHEDAVEKQIKVLQEKREARKKAKELEQLSFARPETPAVKKVVPKTVVDLVRTSGVDWGKASEARSTKPNYGASEETSTAVPVKTTTLRLAKEVVSALTGFEGLSNEQVVGHILNRYLQYNKEKKI